METKQILLKRYDFFMVTGKLLPVKLPPRRLPPNKFPTGLGLELGATFWGGNFPSTFFKRV